MSADAPVAAVKGRDRFIARIDTTALAEVTRAELRTRIELLKAEIEQLDQDEKHVRQDVYGFEKFHYLRDIAKERVVAANRLAKYSSEVAKRETS